MIDVNINWKYLFTALYIDKWSLRCVADLINDLSFLLRTNIQFGNH